MTEPGHGAQNIPTIEQFQNLSSKVGNTLKNLSYTRELLENLASEERQSGTKILGLLENKKKKDLKFSVVDRSIHKFWTEMGNARLGMADVLSSEVISGLDKYVTQCRQQRKALRKENESIMKSFANYQRDAAKQEQICVKEWQKFDTVLTKNDQMRRANKINRVKDLKSTKDKCCKQFSKMESIIQSLNSMEQSAHKQAIDICKLYHQSQLHAADRLRTHYKIAQRRVSALKQWCDENQILVDPDSTPSLKEIQWRFISFPKAHQSSLPCTSQEVLTRDSLVTRFDVRPKPDFQVSKYLTPPENAKLPAGLATQPTYASGKQKKQSGRQQKTEEREATATATDDDDDPFGGGGGNNDFFAAQSDFDDPFAATANTDTGDMFGSGDNDDPFKPTDAAEDPFKSTNDDQFDDPFNSTANDNQFTPADADNQFGPTGCDADDPFGVTSNDEFKATDDDLFDATNDDQFRPATADQFKSSGDDPFQSPNDDQFKPTTDDNQFRSPSGDDLFKATNDDQMMTMGDNQFKPATDDMFKSTNDDTSSQMFVDTAPSTNGPSDGDPTGDDGNAEAHKANTNENATDAFVAEEDDDEFGDDIEFPEFDDHSSDAPANDTNNAADDIFGDADATGDNPFGITADTTAISGNPFAMMDDNGFGGTTDNHANEDLFGDEDSF